MTYPQLGAAAALVFGARVRWSLSLGAAVVGTAMIVSSTFLSGDTHTYAMTHGLTALPFLAVTLVCTRRTIRWCPSEYRSFWQRVFAACVTSAVAFAILVVAAATRTTVLYMVARALYMVSLGFWLAATVHIVRAHVGRRSPSVDLLDALMALVVFGAAALLLVVEPLRRTDQLLVLVPFFLAAVTTPAIIYLSLVNLSRIPKGRRATQAIGVSFALAFTVSVTLNLARLLVDLALPLPVFLGAHVLTLGLLMALPLWAHRQHTGGLERLPDEHQLRQANPMPYVGAVALPGLAVYVLVTGSDRPWGVSVLVICLLVVVVLNAVRHSLMTRETRRLQSGLARMSEERRQLLADVLRALEADRRRTAAELYSQMVGSLATVGSMIQSAHASLPADAAAAVRGSFVDLQGELRGRAEQLRQLMVAMRSPAFDDPATSERPEGTHALAAALLAYASELGRGSSAFSVRVEVEPSLELDWTTTAVVYRVAQEALLNAARHAMASTVEVRVGEEDGGIVLEVRDDGRGFDLTQVEAGSGLATMQLFSQLGRGELSLQSTPGGGTLVRSLLAVRTGDRLPPGRPRYQGRPHLHLVTD
jgi:signal transduction histidine kinase